MRQVRTLGTVVVILILVAVLGSLLGGGMMGSTWPAGMMGPGMIRGFRAPEGAPILAGRAWGLAMAIGMLAMLAFWGALIVGVVLLVRWIAGLTPPAAGPGGAEEPLAILRRRYAAGEIDQATYERMKRELEA
jgi:putative membrane protein